ncbi:MAG: hypothetical protein G3M78_02680 [Candidatus Nitrohelix vancouverensis]|uniref:Antitoxin VbhA domain-containing protein n=1 Tax=Candidatus Nitrohelix vancouverensis TaxID=2705534 RepID=A0A7T0C0M7_9BACT|nr:MAG: hypothetical protein G3M78_02680 [Candidatus Nitrohelix vancouverensis]
MDSLQQKIEIIQSRPSRLTPEQIDSRRRQISDFLIISEYEGILPSALSLQLQDLFAAEKLTASEYLELCRQYSHELRV